MTRLARSLVMACGVALAACASLSISPNGEKFASPVTIWVSANADIEIGSLRATVDGADRTAEFNYGSPGLQGLYATLNLATGTHTVEATANVWNSYDRRYDPRSAKATFEAGPPGSLVLNTPVPNAAAVLPGGSTLVSITIARQGSFGGPVHVGASYPGYAFDDSADISIFDTSVGLTFRARPQSGADELTRRIIATGQLFNGSVRDEKPFTFRIGHRVGNFTRATRAARVDGDTATATDGATLSVGNGPPNGLRYQARFTHPTYGPGTVVQFDPGTPSAGGAGFCQGSMPGFVISGGNSTTQHKITLVWYQGYSETLPLTLPASAPNNPAVGPEIFFSVDCTMMIMVGADALGQHTFQAVVYDIDRRRTFCTVPFNSPAANLQAQLVAPVADNQNLVVTVDGQNINCPLF
jgi:hypothetical protein